MDTITPTELRSLAAFNGDNCVSIYMPTHRVGHVGQQDSLRLKNLTAEAERQLVERGTLAVVARELLTPIADLPHKPSWERRRAGLAIFRSENLFLTYWLAAPLNEAVLIGRRFYVKRLLPATCELPQFFVLAISRDQVRLLKATWQGVERVSLPSLPSSMELALNLQGSDRGEQVHSGMRGNLGKQAAVFHGQGGHRDTLKVDVVNYFRIIDESLGPLVRQHPWPLVLAGVAYELAIFRDVSDYRHIAKEELYGCFDHVGDHALYEQAVPIVKRSHDKARMQAIARYRDLAGTDHASNVVEMIVPAAHEGRIDTLLADPQSELSGRFHKETSSIEFTTDTDPDCDLVETSIAQTILHRGTVYPVDRNELPSARRLRAIFRY